MKAVFHNTKKPPQRIQMKTHYFGKLMPVSVMKNIVGSRSVSFDYVDTVVVFRSGRSRSDAVICS